MPRDSNGVYALPPGNPVTPGTTIEDVWANLTMADIAQALTDSLSRHGQGGMLSPFLFSDGSKAAPGQSWVNEPSSGWFRKSTNEFWCSVGNEEIFAVSKAGITLATGKTATGIIPPTVAFPSGTRMLFQQTSAPVGWTKEASTAFNDRALRLVTGAVGAGGSEGFLQAFNNFSRGTSGVALSIAHMPSHAHGGAANTGGENTGHVHDYFGNGTPTVIQTPNSGGSFYTVINNPTTANTSDRNVGHFHTAFINAEGGGQAHAHNYGTDAAFVDVIVATKD